MGAAGKLWLIALACIAVMVVATSAGVVERPPPTKPPKTEFRELQDHERGLGSKFNIGDVKDDICKTGFPRKDDRMLNDPMKKMKFKNKIKDNKTKEIFDEFSLENPIVDFSGIDMDDVREFLEYFVEEGGELLNITMDDFDITSGEGFKHFAKFLIKHPEFMRLLKKTAVEHVLANLTLDNLEDLCENLDKSEMLDTALDDILKEFPHCVVIAQNRTMKGMGKGLRHGGLVMDRLRSAGLKLNISDFLLDPYDITIEDIDGLIGSMLTDMENLKIINKIVHMLDSSVARRLAERVATELGDPTGWSFEIIDVVVQLMTNLPDELLQPYLNDVTLEYFLNGNFLVTKKVVSFLVDNLYEKRNLLSFNKRFCLSIYYYPYITVTMLDDFTSMELWDALMKCPEIFYELAYSYEDLRKFEKYYEHYDGDDDEGHDDDDDDDDDDDEEDKEGGNGEDEEGDYDDEEDYFHQEWDPEHIDEDFEQEVVESFMKELRPNIKQLRPLMMRIFSDKHMVLNVTELMGLGIFLPAAPSHLFKNIPDLVLMEVWPKLQKFGKFPRETLDVVLDKIGDKIPESRAANASTAHLLGQVILVLPCSDIKNFPAEEMVKFVLSGFFKENDDFSCEMNEMSCRAIAKKAIHDSPKSLKNLVVDNLGHLGSYLDFDDFEDDDIYFNDYLPDNVKKDMFKRKEKKQKEKGEKEEEDSKFEVSDTDFALDAFVKEGGKEKSNKMSFKDAVLLDVLKYKLKKFKLQESNYTEKLGDKPSKRFNATYLMKMNNTIGDKFSMKRFGDVEAFLYEMFEVTFDMIIDWVANGSLKIEDLDFEQDFDDGFSSVNEDFLEEIPESEKSLEFLKEVKMGLKSKAGNNGGSVEQKKLSSGFKMVKKIFGLDGNGTDICMDESVIESLDCYFTRARKSDLKKLSTETRQAIFMAEGKSDECVASMFPDEIMEHFEEFLEVDGELRDANEWDEDLLLRKGPAMLCGMDESHVDKLTPKAAVRLSHQLCHCRQLSIGARMAVFNKIKTHYKNDISNIFKPPYNLDVASCLMYAPKADLMAMTKKAKKIFVAMASKFLDEIKDHLDHIEEMGYFGVEDLVEEKLDAEELAMAVWEIMKELDIPALDRLSQMTHFKSVIDEEFIENLNETDFDEGLDLLRDYDGWTDGQKQALSNKIDKAFGNPKSWESKDVMKLGGLLSAHLENHDDFDEIPMDECSMDFVIDKFSDNEDVFESFCETLNLENAIKIVKKKPEAACCLKPEDAKELNATFIMKAFSMMDDGCHSCLKRNRKLLSAYAEPVSKYLKKMNKENMTDDMFDDLKCLAGKMPQFMDDVSDKALARLDREAIELMDPKVFCKIAKEEYLENIPSFQMDAIDDAKLECLDNEQFHAYWRAVDGSNEDEYEYDEDEVFLDLNVTEIGESEEFDTFVTDFAKPITQGGSGAATVQCVSSRGVNSQGITNAQKAQLLSILDEEETALFNALDRSPTIDLNKYSETDIVDLLSDGLYAFEYSSIDLGTFLDDFPNLVADPDTNDEILREAFEKLNPKIMAMLEPSVTCKYLKKLKKRHLEILCGRLLEEVSSDTFQTVTTKCPVCFTFWINERKNEMMYNIFDKNLAASFFNMRLRQNKPLDLEILALAPKGITPEVIKAVDPKTFGSVSQLTVLSHPKVANHIPKNTIKLILKQIIKGLGPVKSWNKLLKSRLIYFLFHLPRKELMKQITPSDIIQLITGRDGETEGLADPEIRKMLGQAVSKYVMKKSKNIDKDVLESPQVFCLLLSTGMPRKLLDPKTTPYDLDFLLEMAYECGEYYDVPAASSRKFFRTIIKSITKLDEAHLRKLIPLLDLLPPKDIARFPKEILKKLWKEIKDSNLFDEFQLRHFWESIKDGLTVNCTEFNTTIGQLLKVVPRDLIENADLMECLDEVLSVVVSAEDLEIPPAVARALWKMIEKSLASDNMTVSDYIMSENFPLKVSSIVPKSNYDDLKLDFKNKTIRAKAFKIASYIGEELGELIANLFTDLDLDDPEILDDLFEQDEAASVIFSYLDDAEMGQLKTGDSEGGMLEELAKDVHKMTTRTLEKNFGLMKKRINLKDDCTKETICLDEGQAWVLAPLFVGARPNEVECFTQKTRDIIIESIGQNEKLCKRMTKAVIQKLFSFVNPAKAIQDNEDLEILYGCMICGFTKAQIESLSDDEVANLQDIFSECHQFDRDVKDLIMRKIISAYGGFVNYLEENPDVGIGTLLMSVPMDEIKKLSGDALEIIVSSLGDVTSELTEELKDLEERLDRGEVTQKDFDDYSKIVDEILSTLYDLIAPADDVKLRRKRAVSNSDEQCDLLASFNGNLCFLTQVQINSLANQAVADCAAHFQKCSYTDAIFTSLATKAKTALGSPSGWLTNHYAALGKLLGYMGDTAIASMKLTNEVMDAIPKVKITNGEKLFKRYLAHNTILLSQMTGEKISDYVLLLGAMTAQELNDLQPSAVAEAVKTYGLGRNDLKVLEEAVIELFTNKLIESNTIVFATSTTSDISNLGVLAGKLPENVLTGLNSKQKSGIKADAIKLIEPQVLANSFKASDFSAMSSEQANALSKEQLDKLSAEQKAVVTTKTTTVLSSGQNNVDDQGHASTISSSLGLLMAIVFFSIWTVRQE